MDTSGRRKIYAGGRLRKLRRELGLSQSGMANELDISVSYLNLIERNERPLTAQLLIRLSETYSVDPRSFAPDEELRAIAEIEEVFADPMLRSAPVSRNEVRLLVENAPGAAEAIKSLYRAYIEIRALQTRKASHAPDNDRAHGLPASTIEDPVEKTRSFLEHAHNYFPLLESKAEEISSELAADSGLLFEAIVERLRKNHGVRVQIVATDDMRRLVRHYDRHRKKLMISELVDASGRTFQAAFHLGLIEGHKELSSLSSKIGPEGSEVHKLGRVTLANYLAAAVVMPYQKFADAADSASYDLDVLCARFSTSFEQTAHRLTTLARPAQRRVPFFMIRVDAAGNISKRLSCGSFPFSRYGGTCARWNIHGAFRNPGHIESQLVEMPDGTKWFSISRTVQRRSAYSASGAAQFVVGLGCEIKYAHRLIYSRGLDLKALEATPVGINCRLCERPDCAQRAAPALMHRLHISESTRGLSPFEIGERSA